MSAAGQPWVLHVDLDQFIAAVEVLRRPELAGKPVIVGGRGDPTERAVVSTASYEAREFGVGSGMPLRIAARKVPDAVILPVDARGLQRRVRRGDGDAACAARCDRAGARLGRGVRRRRPPTIRRRMRGQLQQAVLERTALHCSVGIGDTLVRAKVATGFGKPRGRVPADRRELAARSWAAGRRSSCGASAPRSRGGSRDSASARSPSWPPPTRTRWSPSSARGWASGTRQLGRGDGATRRRRHALGGARPRPGDDVPAEPRRPGADRRGGARAARPGARRTSPPRAGRSSGLALKVRYAPFFTKTFTKKIASTFDRDSRASPKTMELVAKIEPDRPHPPARGARRDGDARRRPRGTLADAQRMVRGAGPELSSPCRKPCTVV